MKLTYDALGFDANAPLSLNDPVLTPRIRIRGMFIPSDKSVPHPISVVDLRLLGATIRRVSSC